MIIKHKPRCGPRWRNPKGDKRSNVQKGHKLDIKQAKAIKQALKLGADQKYLAHTFKVSISLICRIKQGVLWRHA